MYLISLYFDDKTSRTIYRLMRCAAEKSGNTDMTDQHVPPHITLTAFDSREREEVLVQRLDVVLKDLQKVNLTWVSVAAFFPQVLYLMPVLNRNLHEFSVEISQVLENSGDTRIRECYKPFGWLPHTTVARRLSAEQMQNAFAALQTSFVPFEGTVARVGLSVGSPKREIKTWDLM